MIGFKVRMGEVEGEYSKLELYVKNGEAYAFAGSLCLREEEAKKFAEALRLGSLSKRSGLLRCEIENYN